MSRIDITRDDMQEIREKIQRATSTAHRLLATEVWGNIREKAPQDHGRLAGSFHLSGGDMESTIGSSVVYAAVQEEGRGPYRIYPRNGPRMTFQIDGQWVSVEYVDHPGIPAQRYIQRSIEAGEARIPSFVTTALQREGLA